jgi:hypothetical protein
VIGYVGPIRLAPTSTHPARTKRGDSSLGRPRCKPIPMWPLRARAAPCVLPLHLASARLVRPELRDLPFATHDQGRVVAAREMGLFARKLK